MGSGSRLTAWESRSGQQLPSNVEKGEWQAVKGNSVMISVMGADMHWWSTFRGYGYGKVLTTDTVLGTTTGMSSVDGDDPDDYNHQVRGSISWFKPDLFLGNHDIKVGSQFMRRRSDRPRSSRNRGPDDAAHDFNEGEVPANYDSGNYQLQLRSGVPFRADRVQLSGDASRSRELHRRLRAGLLENGVAADAEPRRPLRARSRLRAAAMPNRRRPARGRRQSGAVLCR